MMEYRELGRTGIQVSQVGFGCEHLQGKDYGVIKPLIDRALDAGVNVFDVFMAEPQVRVDLGKAFSGRRDKVVLQGHIGACFENGQYLRSRDPLKCQAFFEDFMTRLQTDYVDVGMFHYVDTEEDFETVFGGELIRYAERLKAQGTIRAIGMSSHNPLVALKAVKTGKVDVLMFSVNPAYDLLPEDTPCDDLFIDAPYQNGKLTGTNPVRAELYRTCEALGVGITVMKGLGAGMLLNEKASPFGAALTVGQCIHYALTRPGVSSVLVGIQSEKELNEALSYCDMTAEERDYAKILSSVPKYSAKGRCMYCNHCLPCPAGIDVAQVGKFLDLALASGTVPETVKAHYAALPAHAEDCIACGNCEGNCPFAVEVIKRMEQAKEVFGF